MSHLLVTGGSSLKASILLWGEVVTPRGAT